MQLKLRIVPVILNREGALFPEEREMIEQIKHHPMVKRIEVNKTVCEIYLNPVKISLFKGTSRASNLDTANLFTCNAMIVVIRRIVKGKPPYMSILRTGFAGVTHPHSDGYSTCLDSVAYYSFKNGRYSEGIYETVAALSTARSDHYRR